MYGITNSIEPKIIFGSIIQQKDNKRLELPGLETLGFL